MLTERTVSARALAKTPCSAQASLSVSEWAYHVQSETYSCVQIFGYRNEEEGGTNSGIIFSPKGWLQAGQLTLEIVFAYCEELQMDRGIAQCAQPSLTCIFAAATATCLVS